MMSMNDKQFNNLLIEALNRAAEIDYMDSLSDDEIDKLVQPSPHFKNKMKNLLYNPNRHKRIKQETICLRVAKIAAAVVLIATVLFGATMAVLPTSRAWFMNFIRSWYEDRTVYVTPASEIDREWNFGYIPEGFELADKIDLELELVYVFKNEYSSYIHIFISSGGMSVDNENAVFSSITANERTIDIYESISHEHPNIVVLHYEHFGGNITIISEIEIERLIEIAKNIK